MSKPTKSRTVRVDRKALETLLFSGEKLSNIAFNLSQQRGKQIADKDCVMMKECQIEWDEKRRELGV